MKIKENYELVEIGDERMLIPVGDEAQGFRGVVTINEEMAYLARLAREEKSVEELADAMTGEFDVDRETAVRDILAMQAKLDEMGVTERG